MVVSGNISGSFSSISFETAATIRSYSLVNKAGATNTVSAGIILGSTLVEICREPLDSDKSVRETDCYIVIPKGYSLYVNGSGSTDYYFTIE